MVQAEAASRWDSRLAAAACTGALVPSSLAHRGYHDQRSRVSRACAAGSTRPGALPSRGGVSLVSMKAHAGEGHRRACYDGRARGRFDRS